MCVFCISHINEYINTFIQRTPDIWTQLLAIWAAKRHLEEQIHFVHQLQFWN